MANRIFIISEFLTDTAIQVYPNPTNNGTVFIQTTESIELVRIMNVNGQVIRVIDNPLFNENVFEISNLQQGFIFLN